MTLSPMCSNLSFLLQFGVGAGILMYLALPSTCLERCLGCLLLWCYSPASLKWWILYILRGTNAYTVNKTLFSLRWRLPLGLASTPAFAGKGWLKAWLCGPLDPLGVLGVHSCYFS